nr:MAG TPA: EspB-1, type VII secretion system.04A [Caudoviricetes sp.]
MAKDPHKAGQLPRTATKPFGYGARDQPYTEERPTTEPLIGSEYTPPRSRYGSAHHPSNTLY